MKVYWKYDLDIHSPFVATVKTPTIRYLEQIINLMHYGKSVQLKWMCPYKQNKDGVIRYKGQFYLTKYGRIKVSF